jgi:hypothetical protein
VALVECTTLARVKAILAKTDSADDDYLEELLEAVSQRIEDFIDRPIESVSRTEEYDVHSVTQSTIFLRSYPVSSITSITYAEDWDFASATAIDSDLYHLVEETGEVHFRTKLNPGLKVLRVVYTAGLAANTTALIDDYPAIANAADKQVVAEFRRRNSPQASSTNVGGGGIKHEAELQLLKDVRQALTPYRRFRFGV